MNTVKLGGTIINLDFVALSTEHQDSQGRLVTTVTFGRGGSINLYGEDRLKFLRLFGGDPFIPETIILDND